MKIDCIAQTKRYYNEACLFRNSIYEYAKFCFVDFICPPVNAHGMLVVTYLKFVMIFLFKLFDNGRFATLGSFFDQLITAAFRNIPDIAKALICGAWVSTFHYSICNRMIKK